MRYLPSSGATANVVHRDIDLHYIAIRLEVRCLPSSGATANVVHRDIDLHFQSHEFCNVNVKTVKASENFSGVTFIKDDICHEMRQRRNVELRDLDLNFQRHNWKHLSRKR